MRKCLVPLLAAVLSMMFTGVALAASSPTVSKESSSSIGQTGATVSGTIDPDGAKTTYAFQYGPTAAFGAATATKTLSSKTKSTSVKDSLSHLTPGTKYYFRLLATNSYGQTTGITRTFTTAGSPPPGATTGGAEHVGRFQATVTGVVDTDGAPTTVTFQYGTSADYASETTAEALPASATPTPVSATLTGLEPGTVFHYRLFVEHGTVDSGAGSDMTFQTEPFTRPVPKVTSTTKASKRAVLTTTGKIEGSKRFSAGLECTGTVTATYYIGKKKLTSAHTNVASNCTYGITKTVRNPSRHHSAKVTVKVRFSGNGYIAPASAKQRTVTIKRR